MSMSGVTVVGSDAPSDYHVAPRTTENPSQVSGSAPQITNITPTPVTGAGAGVGAVAGALALVKKKRGRPRKYGPDGVAVPSAAALSPKPISSAAPVSSPVIDFSSEKRGKIRPVGLFSKPHMPKLEVENSGKNFNLFFFFLKMLVSGGLIFWCIKLPLCFFVLLVVLCC